MWSFHNSRTWKIPREIIHFFAEKLLEEAGVNQAIIDSDLDNLIYEAGGRNWTRDEDIDDGEDEYFFIPDDYFD